MRPPFCRFAPSFSSSAACSLCLVRLSSADAPDRSQKNSHPRLHSWDRAQIGCHRAASTAHLRRAGHARNHVVISSHLASAPPAASPRTPPSTLRRLTVAGSQAQQGLTWACAQTSAWAPTWTECSSVCPAWRCLLLHWRPPMRDQTARDTDHDWGHWLSTADT